MYNFDTNQTRVFQHNNQKEQDLQFVEDPLQVVGKMGENRFMLYILNNQMKEIVHCVEKNKGIITV